MKGKKTFTLNEAKGIRALLDKKMVSQSNEQNKIRAFLRKFHRFYIEDFSNKKFFGPKDFDKLMADGKIIVITK